MTLTLLERDKAFRHNEYCSAYHPTKLLLTHIGKVYFHLCILVLALSKAEASSRHSYIHADEENAQYGESVALFSAMSASSDDYSEADTPLSHQQVDPGSGSSPSGSVYSTSESSPRSFNERPSSKRQRQKRKFVHNNSVANQSAKRVKPLCNNDYRQLLNTSIEDLNSHPTYNDLEPLQFSQLGASVWSTEEKNVFFRALARRGRHDLRGITEDIGTKSQPEINCYLHLLRTSARYQASALAHKKDLFDVFTTDAAVEVNQKCETALESAADALSLLQYREDERIQKEIHPRFWLLDSGVAKWVNRCQRSGQNGEREVSGALFAADLLDLGAFLNLSKRFFMNSSDPENNWRTHSGKSKAPSIMRTAFSDIHTLAVGLLKRVVQASLLFAVSRIKAETTKHVTPKGAVRRRDILAGLSVLGVEATAKETWIGLARKCNLEVCENVRYKRAWGRHYDYSEAEQILSKGSNRRGRYISKTRESSAEPMPLEGAQSPSSQDKDFDSEILDSDSPASTLSTSEGHFTHVTGLEGSGSEDFEYWDPDDPPTKQNEQTIRHDAYLESLDQKASNAEEVRLWRVLGEDPAIKTVHQETEMPDRPARPRQCREDAVDWTDWIGYVAEWEKLETPVPEARFGANRSLGRETRRKNSLTTHEVEDGDNNSRKPGHSTRSSKISPDVEDGDDDGGGDDYTLSSESGEGILDTTETRRSDAESEDSQPVSDDEVESRMVSHDE